MTCDTSDREVFERSQRSSAQRALYASSLVRTHQTAEAIWPPDFQNCGDAARGRTGRAAFRAMAGHEPRGVSREPAARQPLVADIDEPAPAAKVSWISITACAA